MASETPSLRHGSPAPYLPSLEAARARGCVALDPEADRFELPEGEPTAVRRLAALVVDARLIRREIQDEEASMALARASNLPTEMPPAPTEFADRTALVRVGAVGASEPCSTCDVRKRGHIACPACGHHEGYRCGNCDDGFLPCSACDGAGSTVRVYVRRVHDEHLAIRDTFVPETFRYIPALFPFPALLRAMLDGVDPPMCLAFPIAAPVQRSVYRGNVGPEREPEFEGHRFDDAVEKALEALRRVVKPKTEIALFDVRTFAWPFLWVEFGEAREARAVVLVARPDGQICGFEGDPVAHES